MMNFWLGKFIATLRGYTLENYPFDFVDEQCRKDKSGKAYAAWKLLNDIRSRNLSPHKIIRLILLFPTILLILIRLKLNAAVTAYLTRTYYYKLPEPERRAFLKRKIWGGNPGRSWNRALETVYARHKEFRIPREKLINLISSLDPRTYDGIIELGTGNGWFLNRLSQALKRKIPLIGLDLNPQTVARAKTRYRKNRQLSFVCSDLPGFAKTYSLKRKLLVTCFVLEFFSQPELRELAALMRNNAPSYLAILERITKDSLHRKSLPLGNFSFSHNYERLLKRFGLRLLRPPKRIPALNPSEENLIALFKA